MRMGMCWGHMLYLRYVTGCIMLYILVGLAMNDNEFLNSFLTILLLCEFSCHIYDYMSSEPRN